MSTSILLPPGDLGAETAWLRDLPTDPAEAALVYHAHGWHPVALSPLCEGHCTCPKGALCRRPGKHPWASTWTEPASREAIQEWFAARPDAGVGVLTGHGFWVLDVDGAEGVASLAALEAQHGPLPPTLRVRTGSGGWHLYFHSPAGQRLPSRTRFAPGLDTRADGGQVVAPPSVHASGERYRAFLLASLVAAPPWLVARVDHAQQAPRALSVAEPSNLPAVERARRYLARMPPAIAGQGGDALTYRVACVLCIDYGLSDAEALPLFRDWNARCQPPWTEAELRAKLRSARKHGRGEVGRLTAQKPLRLVVPRTAPVEPPAVPNPPSSAQQGGTSRPALPTPETWTQTLLRTDEGRLKKNLANVITLLDHRPGWEQAIGFDAFAQRVLLAHPTPAHAQQPIENYPRTWRDEDDVLTAAWLQRTVPLEIGVELVAHAVLAVARTNAQHPVRVYLDALHWDGTTRLATWLSAYFGAHDTPYTRAVGSKWLVSAVARIYQPGCKADAMLILEGPQGFKKSSALKALASPAWFTDELADLGSKDAALQLQGAWVVELAELDGLSRAEVARIKAFLTRTLDRYRAPYGRHVLEQPRQCVFAGTVNHATYLRDETGARRFWPVTCTRRASLDELTRDRDQLWAEAVTQYRRGERWWLDDISLEALAREEQDARYQTDEWEQLIADYLEGRPAVTLGELLSGPLSLDKSKWGHTEQLRVVRCLTRLGWIRRRARVEGRPIWKYVPSTEGDPKPEPLRGDPSLLRVIPVWKFPTGITSQSQI